MDMNGALERLGRWWGIQPSYYDNDQRLQCATQACLLRLLQLLGEPLARPEDAPEALRFRRQRVWQTMLEPVLVAWEDTPSHITLRLPRSLATGAFLGQIQHEDSSAVIWPGSFDDLRPHRALEIEGVPYVALRLKLPDHLNIGYNQLTLEFAGHHLEALLLVAPRTTYPFNGHGGHRAWGVFLPLHALHTERSWGAGDFSDLAQLVEWTGRQGGGAVGTLPLLACQWELTGDVSPYCPSSRLFWNHYFLDVTATAEFARCPAAQALLASPLAQNALRVLRSSRQVDYSWLLALKRSVLELLAEESWQNSESHAALDAYVEGRPEAAEFARFCATAERLGVNWYHWPDAPRGGSLRPDDHDQRAFRYWLYAQWQTDTQLGQMAQRASAADVFWYLDYPLGVHSLGFDVWRQRELFAVGASSGAPPDPFFTKGQNWGFPPTHPRRDREQGYRYFTAALRQQMRFAGLMRLDHVMGLHRLYWVPDGFEAREGAYVYYPREELFAILTIESHRHQTGIVGENLGTVPDAVDRALREHRVCGMYVLQYALNPETNTPPIPGVLDAASLNTHDMPTFNAYWRGLDVADRVDLRLLNDDGAAMETRNRANLRATIIAFFQSQGMLPTGERWQSLDEETRTRRVLECSLNFLGQSAAPLVLVNIEDLWLEELAQNTPGTFLERPNWRRRARFALEDWNHPDWLRLLASLHAARQAEPVIPTLTTPTATPADIKSDSTRKA